MNTFSYKDILLKNKSGAVTLVLVLIVLVALIILGVMIVRTSTLETRVIGNKRMYMSDLYQAESGLNYVKYNFDDIIYNPNIYLSKSLTVVGSTTGILSSAWTNISLANLSGTIKFIKTGVPDANDGNSAIYTKTNSYEISVKTPNNAKIDIGIKKGFIKQDD
jgi:Tfp pilus assembly protein PilX